MLRRSAVNAHVHDAIDNGAMSVVIFALLPALLFGMYNGKLNHRPRSRVFLLGYLLLWLPLSASSDQSSPMLLRSRY